jgi:hypothetical protein
MAWYNSISAYDAYDTHVYTWKKSKNVDRQAELDGEVLDYSYCLASIKYTSNKLTPHIQLRIVNDETS